MKYIKFTNVPQTIFRQAKFKPQGPQKLQFNWQFLGLDPEMCTAGAFQYTKDDNDTISHWPIADEQAFNDNGILEKMLISANLYSTALTKKPTAGSIEVIDQEEADKCRATCDKIRAEQALKASQTQA